MSQSKLIFQQTKTLVTRDNGRSADAISPNFVYGCLGGCMKTYCYVARFNADKVYVNNNTKDILQSVNNWVEEQPWPKAPNQTDDKYYTIDIGCSTDVALHQKNMPLQDIFSYFNEHPRAKSTFATKYPTKLNLDKYSVFMDKNRVRVSLMPQIYSSILEPNTDRIADRIASIPHLMEHMEVHINFSPVIVTEGWRKEYIKLFQQLYEAGIDLPCEVIFLTYNQKQADKQQDYVTKYLLNRPEWQEEKDSQYAPGNLRYKHEMKAVWMQQFTDLYKVYFKSPTRYIF